MRDPYSIYARHILKLKPLDDIDAPFGAADKGTLLHKVLETYLKSDLDVFAPDAVEQLKNLAVDVCHKSLKQEALQGFWLPRFERIARWFVETERQYRSNLECSYTEVSGQMTLQPMPGGNFTVSAKADRIDILKDGTASIIDYKTGGVPSGREVSVGQAPQLPLEAAILKYGSFEDVPRLRPKELSFWWLTGGTPPGEIRTLKEDGESLADQAVVGLKNLITQYDDVTMPYHCLAGSKSGARFNDYIHLSRVDEWVKGVAA